MAAKSLASVCRAVNPCLCVLVKAIDSVRSVSSRGVPEWGQLHFTPDDCYADGTICLGVSLACSFKERSGVRERVSSILQMPEQVMGRP